MINKNKVGKYLLYAIGEIVLIVIGILIALQLNILNDVSKNKQLEINYLYGIIVASISSHIKYCVKPIVPRVLLYIMVFVVE